MLTVPGPMGELDERAAKAAPTGTGVYAAWLTTTQSLAQCGVAGPPPRVVYIGKASGRGGLRARLLRHARTPFWDLLDLLASRGTVLPGWWHHAYKDQPYLRTLKAPPLAKLAEDQALAWQHRHLRWGWVTLDEPRPLEYALIAQHQPLLNLHGRGFGALGPPSMRWIGEFESARASWLFSIAWIAVLTAPGAEGEWCTWNEGTRAVGMEIDDDAWPTRIGGGGRPITLGLPTEEEARRIVRKVRRTEFNDHDDEALAWWSAYAGIPFRPARQPHDEALRYAFAQEVDALDVPRLLPASDRRGELLKLVKLLPGVAH